MGLNFTMNYNIGNIEFSSDTKYNLNMNCIECNENFLKLKISLDFKEPIVPDKVTVLWELPFSESFSQWNPTIWYNHNIKPNWSPVKLETRSAYGAPIQTYMSIDDKNCITVALSDVKTPCMIISGVVEETSKISFKLELFCQKINPIDNYETELWIDMRKIYYGDAINEVSAWWNELGYSSSYVPENACLPMYSTWYSYHQKLDHQTLVDELKLAKSFGMETVIIDDGWQTDNSERGYAYCGDWKAVKLDRMEQFVKDVHDIGMKVMLWYSVPYVGKYSLAYNRFSDCFLHTTDRGWSILDPRYPEVRKYLTDIYKNAVLNWKIDGLKLDFIDAFAMTEQSHEPNDRMDFCSLEDAVCALLSDIKSCLMQINPEILIEFRQSYIGPIMRTYGNMIRVGDCPTDAIQNRTQGAYLRLTSGQAAVHSDMLMWAYEDSPQVAALQIINSLFCVPQISVLIEKLSHEHKKMLKFYLDFWKTNRDCLLKGKFKAENPAANFTLISSEYEDKLIAISYGNSVLDIETNFKELIFINASSSKKLYINNDSDAYDAQLLIMNCMGDIIEKRDITVKEGINTFSVQLSGLVILKQNR